MVFLGRKGVWIRRLLFELRGSLSWEEDEYAFDILASSTTMSASATTEQLKWNSSRSIGRREP